MSKDEILLTQHPSNNCVNCAAATIRNFSPFHNNDFKRGKLFRVYLTNACQEKGFDWQWVSLFREYPPRLQLCLMNRQVRKTP